MNFLELAKKRFSVRKFSREKVDENKIKILMEAAQTSPTAVNYQPQRIKILQSDYELNLLKECTRYHFHAPLAFIIGYDNKVSWKREFDNMDMGIVDASIVTTVIMFEAEELGLGTTWVGHFDPAALKDKFKLAPEFVPVAILPLGYAAEECKPHPLHFQRFDPESYLI